MSLQPIGGGGGGAAIPPPVPSRPATIVVAAPTKGTATASVMAASMACPQEGVGVSGLRSGVCSTHKFMDGW